MGAGSENDPADEPSGGLRVGEKAGRIFQRHAEPGHRRYLRRVDPRRHDEYVELEVADRGLDAAQLTPTQVELTNLTGRLHAGTELARLIPKRSSRRHRVNAPLLFGVSRRQDWPRLDLGLERPKFLLVDEVDGIAPGLMVRHLLPKPSGPLDIPEPLEASAPLHTKLAVKLALQVAIAEGAEPIELVVRIGSFREPRIDPGEGVSSGGACQTYLFEERNLRAALREMVGDGAP